MQKSNIHVHSHFSDGRSSMEETVQTAIELQFDTIGFSDHVPLSFKPRGHMVAENFDSYISEIERLRSVYGNRITILAGLEVDYLFEGETFYDRNKLDYIIGSIHFMGMINPNTGWSIDGNIEKFEQGLQLLCNGSKEKFIGRYYDGIRRMVKELQPNVIGHIDKVKLRSPAEIGTTYYKQEVLDTLDVIAQTNIMIEVNTKGAYACGELYPSEWILRACKERGITVCITTDAHHKDCLNTSYTEAERLLLEIGFVAHSSKLGKIMV